MKALWIVSNLIVLILLPVHGRRKSAHRVGFPFVTALSSLPGNTPHSSHNHSLSESGYCGWASCASNPASFQCNACKYHRSLDLYFCKQCQIMSGMFSVIWRSFCFDTSSLNHGGLLCLLGSATFTQIIAPVFIAPVYHTWASCVSYGLCNIHTCNHSQAR